MAPMNLMGYFLNDPLFFSFFNHMVRFTDQKEKQKKFLTGDFDKEPIELEMDDEGMDEVTEPYPQWKRKYDLENDFHTFFVALTDRLGAVHVVYELRRFEEKFKTPKGKIDVPLRKDFYQTLFDELSNWNNIDKAIERVSAPIYPNYGKKIFATDESEMAKKEKMNFESMKSKIKPAYEEIRKYINNHYLLTPYSMNMEFKIPKKTVPPPFVWCGDNTNLGKLILTLSVKDWLKINPAIETVKNLAFAFENIFVQRTNDNILEPISESTFRAYFAGKSIDDINTIIEKELYDSEVQNEKMKFTKEIKKGGEIKEVKKNPFITIEGRLPSPE